MKMTDELLSGFLDNELSESEMDAVRDQIALDPALADRLAELASVDAELQRHYGAIDDQPMPEAVIRLLEQPLSAARPDNVVAFHWWRRLRDHSGKAIAAAVIAGFAMNQWLNSPAVDEPHWPAVAKVLEHEPSGDAYVLDSTGTLTPQLTFQNREGDWCRQFRVDLADNVSEQIACRDNAGTWELLARVEVQAASEPGTFQTASGGHVLDEALDQMMSGSPLAPEQEQGLLEQRWSGR